MQEIPDARIFVVLQAGGSSREEYIHAFNSGAIAARYARDAANAGYRTSLAHAVPIP